MADAASGPAMLSSPREGKLSACRLRLQYADGSAPGLCSQPTLPVHTQPNNMRGMVHAACCWTCAGIRPRAREAHHPAEGPDDAGKHASNAHARDEAGAVGAPIAPLLKRVAKRQAVATCMIAMQEPQAQKRGLRPALRRCQQGLVGRWGGGPAGGRPGGALPGRRAVVQGGVGALTCQPGRWRLGWRAG